MTFVVEKSGPPPSMRNDKRAVTACESSGISGRRSTRGVAQEIPSEVREALVSKDWSSKTKTHTNASGKDGRLSIVRANCKNQMLSFQTDFFLVYYGCHVGFVIIFRSYVNHVKRGCSQRTTILHKLILAINPYRSCRCSLYLVGCN